MTIILTKFIASVIAIVLAGTFLTRFSDRIAELTGWGRLFVGSLLLAGATSLPELMVDLKSIQLNLPDLAVGDLLGSSLFNLLILSVLDFSYPWSFRGTTFSPRYLKHALSAVLSIVLTTVVAMAMIADISYSFLEINYFLWFVLLIYLYGLRLVFIDEGLSESKLTVEYQRPNLKKIFLAFSGYLASAMVIFLSAPYLVEASDELARMSGLGHTFVGTTVVAFSTSLPELVATLAAFRIGSPELALGNIFGSNAFNMILFLPLDYYFPGALFSNVSSHHIVTALSSIMATSIAVIGQLYRKKERSRLTEPSSEMVVVVILSSLLLLYFLKN